MAYTVITTKKAKKDLRKYDPQVTRRIEQSIKDLGASLPERTANWSRVTKGSQPHVQYGATGKLTVGKYRALTIIDDSAQRVAIPRVFKRGDRAYGFSEDDEDVSEKRTVLQEDTRIVMRRIMLGIPG